MNNIKNIFPTKTPLITEERIFIPRDLIFPKGLLGNDLIYLIIFYADIPEGLKSDKIELLNECRKSRTSEWRRIKRLKKLNLI